MYIFRSPRFSNTLERRQNSQKNKSLLLLALDWGRPKDPPMSLGQASILANLNKYSINVKANSWSVNHPEFSVKQVCDFISANADMNTDLAMGAFIWNENYVQKIIKNLKTNNFPGRIILGGPQISYVKPGANRKKLEAYYPEVDIFIRGYAENALVDLMRSNTEFQEISGVHYAKQSDLGTSAAIDLENIPSPFLTGLISPQKFIRWETQRGCPFRCSFCQHRESDVSMKRQQFSQTRIMKEIDWIIANPAIQDIAVLDPTFNSGPHYLNIVHALSSKKYHGKISLQCRIEMVKEEFLDAIEELNKTASVVLEFGLQTIHKNEGALIERPNNIEKVKKILTETKERKIATEVSLIYGLPGQTIKSFTESIEFCKALQVPTIYAFPLMLLRGTPLFDKKSQLGLVESDEIVPGQALPNRINQHSAHIPHVIESKTFTKEDWQIMAKLAAELDNYNTANNKSTEIATAKMSETLRHTLWDPKNNNSSVDPLFPRYDNVIMANKSI